MKPRVLAHIFITVTVTAFWLLIQDTPVYAGFVSHATEDMRESSDGEGSRAKKLDTDRKEERRLEKLKKEAKKLKEARRKALRGVSWGKRHILKSRHYELHCNSSKEVAKMYLRVLEALYKKYGKVFAALNPKARVCIVHIRRNQREFMQAYRKPAGVGGFYQPSSRLLSTYHGKFGLTGSTLTVLAHEGCHQFQHMFAKGNMMGMPMWILEGLAVVFESAQIDTDGKVELVGLNPDRLTRLQDMIRKESHVTLEEMLVAPRLNFTASHYCTSGAFTWWLLKGSKNRKYKKLYEQFLSSLINDGKIRWSRRGYRDNGAIFERLAKKITGKTIDELASEWREYVLGLKAPKFGVYTGDRFVSSKYGFEVGRPNNNWLEVDEKELAPGQLMSWVHKKKKATFSVYCIPADSTDGIDGEIKDFKLLDRKKTYVSGYEAEELSFEGRKMKGESQKNITKTRSITVVTPQRTYHLVAKGEPKDWKKVEKDFNKMFNSFKLDTWFQ